MESTSPKEAVRLIQAVKTRLSGPDMASYISELTELGRMAASDHFKVAVVGSHGAGRMAFVNTLIGRSLLPEEVMALEEIGLTIRAGEETTRVPWDTIFETERPLSELALVVKDEWLESLGLVIDCPKSLDGDMVDDDGSNDDGFDFSIRIAPADAVFLVIHATRLFSQGERRLLEHVTRHGYVPHLAVVVTRMDLVAAEERERVIKHIEGRLAALGRDIPLVADGADRLLESWVESESHHLLKENSLRRRLSLLIDRIEKDLVARQIRLGQDEERKHRELQQLRYRIEQKDLQWDEIRMAALTKANECTAQIKTILEKSRDMTISRLQFELSHTNNPKAWWEHDLPYKINMELSAATSGLERTIDAKLIQDVQWLQAQVKTAFAGNVRPYASATAMDTVEFEIKPAGEDIQDTDKARDIMRLVTGGATAAVFLIFAPPIGINVLLGVVTTLIGEKYMTGKIKDQGEALAELLKGQITRHYAKVLTGTAEKVDLLYAALLEEIKKERAVWNKKQENALGAQPAFKEDPALAPIATLISELEEIKMNC